MSSSGQTVETEIKLRIADPDFGRQLLDKAGFHIRRPRVFEANVLLDTADLSLRNAGSLLRLRQAGDQFVLTFKGPSMNSHHKVREELEISLSDLDTAQRIFQRLGYRRVFRYEKYRTEFSRHSENGIATLDETPIGTFLELEGPADWIDAEANTLGFTLADYITASYGQLYRQDCATRGLSPADMVF